MNKLGHRNSIIAFLSYYFSTRDTKVNTANYKGHHFIYKFENGQLVLDELSGERYRFRQSTKKLTIKSLSNPSYIDIIKDTTNSLIAYDYDSNRLYDVSVNGKNVNLVDSLSDDKEVYQLAY